MAVGDGQGSSVILPGSQYVAVPHGEDPCAIVKPGYVYMVSVRARPDGPEMQLQAVLDAVPAVPVRPREHQGLDERRGMLARFDRVVQSYLEVSPIPIEKA